MNRRIVNEFLMEYMASGVIEATTWQGVPVHKNPFDLWIYQEIILETRPTLILEMGTAQGGSALWMASILDLIGDGSVLTVDIVPPPTPPKHPRIEYLQRSSLDPAVSGILTTIDSRQGERRWMVVLDSCHEAGHVLQELNLYGPAVTPGCYLIVEDTILGHPYLPDPSCYPGPAEALAQWLPEHPEFEVDRNREKFGMTFHPGGYLRRLP